MQKSSVRNRAVTGSEPSTSQPLSYLLGAAVAAAGIGALLPTGLAWAFLHPPRRLHHVNPRAAFGAPYERIRLTAEDGIALSAWYVPVPPEQVVRGMVVVCHGYSGNRATMLPYVKFLRDAGYATFLFDFRAHGWSGGQMTTFGCRESLDLRAALDWAFFHPELRELPLVVLGESMGASVALLVAGEEPRIRAVVADSPYARFDSAVEGRLRLTFGPLVGTAITPSARRAGEKLLGVNCTDIAPVEAITRIAPRPVFLIHGSEDRLITPENSRHILEAAPGNAERWVVEGAEHVRSVHVAGEEYGKRVLAFLERALA